MGTSRVFHAHRLCVMSLAVVAAVLFSGVCVARAELIGGDQVLVASYSDDVVKCYDPDTGEFIQDFAPALTFRRPTTLGIGPDGLLYIVSQRYGASSSTGKITRWNLDGTPVDTFVTGVSAYIDQMVFGPDGMLYVTNRSAGLLRYDPAKGPYTGDNVFIPDTDVTLGVAFDSSGNIFLSEYSTQDIEKYNAAGVFQSTLVDLTGTVSAIGSLAIDSSDNLYVTNYGANVIKVTPAGAATTIVSDLAQSTVPNLGPDDKLYVGDGTNDIVNRYNLDGSAGELFIATGAGASILDYPCGMLWTTVVPEPSTLALLFLGLLALIARGVCKNRV